VECRAEELLDQCVSASLSVLDTDQRGAPLSLPPCVASETSGPHTYCSDSKSEVNGHAAFQDGLSFDLI